LPPAPDDTVALQLPPGAAVGGAPLSVPADGVALQLTLPAGRQLDHARLVLASASLEERPVTPVAVTTDTGQLTSTPVRWVTARLAHEVVLTRLRIDGADAASTSARVKLLSRGAWVPLAPIDTIAVATDQALSAVTALQVMAELLVPAADKSPVRVPGPGVVTAMTVTGTNQACHVALAIGEDAPFFTQVGPLAAEGIAVDGLARAINRYLLDRPGSTAVSLRLSAAGPAQVAVTAFEATLAPPPLAPVSPSQPGLTPPPVETIYLHPAASPGLARAQLCDAGHVVAQGFDKLPPGLSLSGVDLYLRSGTDEVVATIGVYADADGAPAATPIAGGVMTLAQGQSPAPVVGFVTCRPAAPLALSGGSWWLVCQMTSGECLWFTDAPRPAGAGQTLARTIGSAWVPAPATLPAPPATDPGWAQTILRTIAAATGQAT
jgi:hypothetical protein